MVLSIFYRFIFIMCIVLFYVFRVFWLFQCYTPYTAMFQKEGSERHEPKYKIPQSQINTLYVF